jgi:hypothetical protein
VNAAESVIFLCLKRAADQILVGHVFDRPDVEELLINKYMQKHTGLWKYE